MSPPTNETTKYLPIPWTITSLDPTLHACPSPSSLLGTFAIVNGIVSLLSVLFGHRRVVEELTCGFFGKRGSQSWKILWIVPVGLQLAANACIAVLVQRADGYAANFKITDLMLWLTARPRLGWIVLVAWGSVYGSPDPRYFESNRSLANPYIHVPTDEAEVENGLDDYPWWSAFMTQFIAEFVLQSMAMYIMGRTAHYGAARNYYSIHLESYWQIPAAARMMYSGALYYLVAGSVFLIFAFFFIIYQMLSSKVKNLGKGNTVAIIIALWFLLISSWLGSWLFWAGFVKLAGDQYCPPKLIHQGAIWTLFSTSGIILGAGV
ncbi:hypothetical protein GQ44DRAFT_726275 [Phaeosphaeriaceae sp. PMI808]|nr:hypothetical protein GQ44DRAFT_726275 [Phaeosphaeriaceae sp. PMI808]